jgi:L-erythro-3,5-diaminohexanoate dehydrogenase
MPPAPDPFGIHRSLDPPGSLPQSARKLDASPACRHNEILARVRALSVDAASFRQLRETEDRTGETVAAQILRIVAERGKLQNPVTGSGGMFIGVVEAVGEGHPARNALQAGDSIASLVSLTLTPLSLDGVRAVHPATERVEVDGHAILFERTLFARMPADFPEAIALAAFDVAGAPATVRRHARPGGTVVVIGAGKAGMLSIAASRDAVGATGRVVVIEPVEAAALRAERLAMADAVLRIDARNPVALRDAVAKATGGRMGDLVLNVVNAPGTESATLLAARDDGTVIFFGMATSFSAAALGAEGLACAHARPRS